MNTTFHVRSLHDCTKTIRLLAFDFYEVKVDEGELSSHRNQKRVI